MDGIEVIETEWGSELHKRLVAEEHAARVAWRNSPEAWEEARQMKEAGPLKWGRVIFPEKRKKNANLQVVKIVSLKDFEDVVVEAANSAIGDFVLIGGLAVGAWAQYFKVPCGGPIFSKDIDLRGTRLVAQTLAQGMKLRGAKVKGLVAAKRKVPAGMGMNYVVPLDLADGRSTVIEVLEALPWVDDGPDRPYGFGVEVEGIPLLDPLSLFIGKLHAWHHRDDPEKTSNDRLHLELLGEIIPKFLAEAKRRGVDTQERCHALLHFLDRHATPLSEEAFAGLRQALESRSDGL